MTNPENNPPALPPQSSEPGKKPSKLLFPPGNIYSTPAVLRQLHAHNISVTWLIAMHCSGLWGELDDEDKRSNDDAVASGARILSAYDIEGERVWVITESVDGLGRRHTTTLLRPEEF